MPSSAWVVAIALFMVLGPVAVIAGNTSTDTAGNVTTVASTDTAGNVSTVASTDTIVSAPFDPAANRTVGAHATDATNATDATGRAAKARNSSVAAAAGTRLSRARRHASVGDKAEQTQFFWHRMHEVLARVAPTPPPAAGPTAVHLRSLNYPNHFVRHSNWLGRIDQSDGSDLFNRDSTFKMVPGLGNGGATSFESTNYPGNYLRHQDFRIKLNAANGNNGFNSDATFWVRPGLGNNAWKSFESINFPGYYIRHSDFWLRLDRFDGSDTFRRDSTFEIQNVQLPNPPPPPPPAWTQWQQALTQRGISPADVENASNMIKELQDQLTQLQQQGPNAQKTMLARALLDTLRRKQLEAHKANEQSNFTRPHLNFREPRSYAQYTLPDQATDRVLAAGANVSANATQFPFNLVVRQSEAVGSAIPLVAPQRLLAMDAVERRLGSRSYKYQPEAVNQYTSTTEMDRRWNALKKLGLATRAQQLAINNAKKFQLASMAHMETVRREEIARESALWAQREKTTMQDEAETMREFWAPG